MIIGCHKNDVFIIRIAVTLFDQLFGELHVLVGVSRFLLLHNCLIRNTAFSQVTPHRDCFRHRLIAALTSGRNQDSLFTALLFLLFPEFDCLVDAASQKRRQRSVLSESAAKDQNIVLHRCRNMPGSPQSADHRTDKYAFEVSEYSVIHAAQCVEDTHLHFRPAEIHHNEPDAEGFTCDQGKSDPQAENILHAETLVPQQRDIAHDHQNREYQHHRHEDHREDPAGKAESLIYIAHPHQIRLDQTPNQYVYQIQPGHGAKYPQAAGPDRVIGVHQRSAQTYKTRETDHSESCEEQSDSCQDSVVPCIVPGLHGISRPQAAHVQFIIKPHCAAATRHSHAVVAGLLRAKDDRQFPFVFN